MPRTRWTDDRLDDRISDLAHDLREIDARLDVIGVMATRSRDELEDLRKRDSLSSRTKWERWAIAAALSSPFVTALLHFIPSH